MCFVYATFALFVCFCLHRPCVYKNGWCFGKILYIPLVIRPLLQIVVIILCSMNIYVIRIYNTTYFQYTSYNCTADTIVHNSFRSIDTWLIHIYYYCITMLIGSLLSFIILGDLYTWLIVCKRCFVTCDDIPTPSLVEAWKEMEHEVHSIQIHSNGRKPIDTTGHGKKNKILNIQSSHNAHMYISRERIDYHRSIHAPKTKCCNT